MFFFLEVNYSNRTGNVIGWGRSEYLSKSQPNILQELQVPIWDNESCVTNTKYKDKEITHNMFCAGFVEGQRDSCVVRILKIPEKIVLKVKYFKGRQRRKFNGGGE